MLDGFKMANVIFLVGFAISPSYLPNISILDEMALNPFFPVIHVHLAEQNYHIFFLKMII